jgi:hypothetical protein
MQNESYDAWKGYNDKLAAGTNDETTREISRYRDDISTGMKSEGEAAMGRGADAGLFRSRAMQGGQRGMAELQGRLADVSLNRREGALKGQTDAASAAAGEQRLTHLGTMSANLDQQRVDMERADQQSRMQDKPYDRLMQMMQSVGNYRDAFGAFQEGSTAPVGPLGVGSVGANVGGSVLGGALTGRRLLG